MAGELIMAVGMDCTADDEKRKAPQSSLKDVLRKSSASIWNAIDSIEKNKGIVSFGSYEKAEEAIKVLYEYSSRVEDARDVGEKLLFYVVLVSDDPADKLISAKIINLLNSIMEEKRENAQPYPVQVYVTGDVYQNLAPAFQDLYHSAVEVASIALHQRFSENAQRCFVISPIGGENTEIRKRADHIFEKYIKPACETTPFRAVRGEMMTGNRITSELMEALQSDPMVIVYLGNPRWGWNPNVMYELGIREANAGPYVVIKDDTSEGKAYNLPFDLKDTRIIEVPEQEEDSLDTEYMALKIRTIRERILAGTSENRWDAIYPAATAEFKVGDPSEGGSRFIEASKDLETLFDMKGIVGRDISAILKHLLAKMPSSQREAFMDDQKNVIAQLLISAAFGVHGIHATVPIVFEEHNQYKGRAFLPIIVKYNFNKLTNTLKLKILYIDVTSATKLDEKLGCFVCTLKGNGTIDLGSSVRS